MVTIPAQMAIKILIPLHRGSHSDQFFFMYPSKNILRFHHNFLSIVIDMYLSIQGFIMVPMDESLSKICQILF